MCSAVCMYVPSTGTFTSSAFANDHSNLPAKKPWRTGTSNHDMWFAATSTVSSLGGKFSSPSTFGAEKPMESTILHQECMIQQQCSAVGFSLPKNKKERAWRTFKYKYPANARTIE